MSRVSRLVPIVAGLALLGAFAISKYSQREREVFVKEKRIRAHQIIEAWEKQDYLAIDSSPHFRESMFAKLTVKNREGIDGELELMTDALKESVYLFLIAFSEGSYEAFRRFRTPVAHVITEDTQSMMRQSLTSNIPLQVFLPPTNSAPGERKSIRQVMKTASQLGLSIPESASADELDRLCFSLVSQGTAFRGHITSICLDRSELRIDFSDKPISPLQQSLGDFEEELGTTIWGSGYAPVVTADEILSRSGRIIYATCRLLVRPISSDWPRPIFLTIFWNEAEKKWVPWELGCASVYSKSYFTLYF